MIIAIYLVCIITGLLFLLRLTIGPSLADRVLGLNGLLLVGMGTILTQSVASGSGAFLPVLVALALVGPISNGMIARYIEGVAKP